MNIFNTLILNIDLSCCVSIIPMSIVFLLHNNMKTIEHQQLMKFVRKIIANINLGVSWLELW